ncbi:MAG: hypothetical protein K8S13_00690 [Desulfobacula sp.]|uniref:hypothetical protein n=1 Tax=Desulfobacula sp. TaxID=2593537 RepID=UPI0025BF1B71|nr:hypothetical protein [Desulfobacula sp.]MCD4718364.1 hypothetical protein [Desulfobacula sp.]
MKKIFIITAICFITFGFTSISMASTVIIDADDNGVLSLPGCAAINLSRGGIASYSSETTAGGYAGANEGEQWCINTASTKGTDEIALEFIMRGSAGSEDNNLYQRLTGTVGTLTGVDTNPSTLAGGWSIRGGN